MIDATRAVPYVAPDGTRLIHGMYPPPVKLAVAWQRWRLTMLEVAVRRAEVAAR